MNYTYHCRDIEQLPFKGTEFLVVSALFVFSFVVFCVSYFDVAVKQLFPQFIDPNVLQRVALIQKKFPNLWPGPYYDGEEEEEEEQKRNNNNNNRGGEVLAQDGSIIRYKRCVAQTPYLSSISVDYDLVVSQANRYAIGTVSGYSSETTRGTMTLISFLIGAACCLGMAWTRASAVDPFSNGGELGVLQAVGMIIVGGTGIVECGDYGSVWRDANILLFFSAPYHILQKGKWIRNPILRLHDICVYTFIALPLAVHAYVLYLQYEKKTFAPNFWPCLFGAVVQLIGVVLFFGVQKMKSLPYHTRRRLTYVFECVAVMSAFVAYVHWVCYPLLYCANHVSEFNYLLVIALFGPILLMAKKQFWTPEMKTSPCAPSLLLMGGDEADVPVATVGNCAAVEFWNDSLSGEDREEKKITKDLPRITSVDWQKK